MASATRTSASDGTEPIGILRLLFWLRAFAIVAQCAAVWVAQYVLAAPLPIRPIVITVGALALWNVLGYRDLLLRQACSASRGRAASRSSTSRRSRR